MHESVMAWVKNWIEPGEVSDRRVLEVGSRNINGSVREIIEPMKPDLYLGVDRNKGRGVDVVADWTAPDFTYNGKWHLVISTEMLEHCKDWQCAVNRMKSALAPNGILMITTRSPGFGYHEPPDYWRFTVQDFQKIFAEMAIDCLGSDSQVPGVFLKCRPPRDGSYLDSYNLKLNLSVPVPF